MMRLFDFVIVETALIFNHLICISDSAERFSIECGNSHLIWFCIAIHDWSTKFTPLCNPIGNKTRIINFHLFGLDVVSLDCPSPL